MDFSYHQNYYKLISIDLSRKTNTSIPQQINFIGNLKEDDDAIMFIAEKQQKTVLNLSLDPLILRTSNILNLLNESSDSKFVTRKWNIVNNQPNYEEMKLSITQKYQSLIVVITMTVTFQQEVISLL